MKITSRAVRTEFIRYAAPFLSARFEVKGENLTEELLKAHLGNIEMEMKILMQYNIISRYYKKLHVRTGRLLRSATYDFDVDVVIRDNVITINFLWHPGPEVINYFYIHLFGGIIRAGRGRWLMFRIDGEWKKVKQVRIPRRNYIKMTQGFIDDMAMLLRKRLFVIPLLTNFTAGVAK